MSYTQTQVPNSHKKKIIIQDDINKLLDWCSKQSMELNVKKCKIMHYGKTTLTGDNKILEASNSERDLGVIESNN